MRIWFDISNSPHINMFYQLIKELEAEGHEIVITSRPLANTVELLDQAGLAHRIIGNHYGRNIFYKIFGYPIRVTQLYNYLKNKRIDIAISQSSFHSPLVGRMLGIPSIYTNDNEHAIGNIPAFLFANRILIPESLSKNKVAKMGGSIKKIIQYPGVKEGIYLWSKYDEIAKHRKINNTEKVDIYIRPEPRTAQYYKGGLNFLDNIIINLQKRYSVTILPRDQVQANHYTHPNFGSTIVAKKTRSIESIAEKCSLFIGAGGSMTRELAMLGIPTISVYQDELLDVDKYLIENKIMNHIPDISIDKIEDIIKSVKQDTSQPEMMVKGKNAYQLFKRTILGFNH
jgi:predicted glycosyltransferase